MLHRPSSAADCVPRYRYGRDARAARASVRPLSLRHGSQPFSIGLFVPMIGVAGIWGPSTIACATLAAEEVNRDGGLHGHEMVLKCFNASDEADDVTEMARDVVDMGDIDAIVGMHTSSVRHAVIRGCQGRIPYVYTALHEGGERSCGVYTLGETPERQLRPAITLLASRYRARRWVFVGNDYEWPRISHRLASDYVHGSGAQVLADHYVPLGCSDFDALLQALEELRPDAVLLSLVGQDAVNFNRAFGQAGLGRKMLRLSCAVEENMLLAMGADNTDNLFVSAGYFGALGDDDNMGFKERYHQRFGRRAPTLNALGQSTYEGVKFAAALALQQARRAPGAGARLSFKGVRGIQWCGNDQVSYPVHLARADGHFFQMVQSF